MVAAAMMPEPVAAPAAMTGIMVAHAARAVVVPATALRVAMLMMLVKGVLVSQFDNSC
jgi:hypothetical protein